MGEKGGDVVEAADQAVGQDLGVIVRDETAPESADVKEDSGGSEDQQVD